MINRLQYQSGGIFTSESSPEIVVGTEILKSFRKEGEDIREDVQTAPPLDWLRQVMSITMGNGSAPGDDGALMESESETKSPVSRKYKGRICGIIQGTETSDFNYQSYMNLSAAKKMIRENRKLSKELGLEMNRFGSALVVANDMEHVTSILQQIREMGFDAYSPVDTIDTIKAEQNRQQGQLSLIAFVSLLVSAIGIANTMLTSILERKAQIGVMKVIGLSISRIRGVFLVESALIGLGGGIMGCVLSLLFSLILSNNGGESTVFGMYFAQGIHLIIPLWLLLSALAVSVTIGVLSGIYPAVRATKMSPLEAMRGS